MLRQTSFAFRDALLGVRVMILQYVQVCFNAIVLDGLVFQDGVKVRPLLKYSLVIVILRAGDYMEEPVDGVQSLCHVLLLK